MRQRNRDPFGAVGLGRHPVSNHRSVTATFLERRWSQRLRVRLLSVTNRGLRRRCSERGRLRQWCPSGTGPVPRDSVGFNVEDARVDVQIHRYRLLCLQADLSLRHVSLFCSKCFDNGQGPQSIAPFEPAFQTPPPLLRLQGLGPPEVSRRTSGIVQKGDCTRNLGKPFVSKKSVPDPSPPYPNPPPPSPELQWTTCRDTVGLVKICVEEDTCDTCEDTWGGGGPLPPTPQIQGGRGVVKRGSKGHELISPIQMSETFCSNLLIAGGGIRMADNHRLSPPPPPLSDTVTVTVTDCDSASGFVMEYA